MSAKFAPYSLSDQIQTLELLVLPPCENMHRGRMDLLHYAEAPTLNLRPSHKYALGKAAAIWFKICIAEVINISARQPCKGSADILPGHELIVILTKLSE